MTAKISSQSIAITKSLEQEVVKPLIAQAQSVEVVNEQDVESASVFLKQVHEGIKGIEEERKKITSPLSKSLRATNALFKKISKPLVDSKAIIKSKILSWQVVERNRIAKEEQRRRRIQMAHIEKGHNVEEMVQIARPEKTIGNSQVRKIWTYRITNFSEVSDEFKVIDTKAVKAIMRSTREAIPGIEFYQKEQLAVV